MITNNGKIHWLSQPLRIGHFHAYLKSTEGEGRQAGGSLKEPNQIKATKLFAFLLILIF